MLYARDLQKNIKTKGRVRRKEGGGEKIGADNQLGF